MKNVSKIVAVSDDAKVTIKIEAEYKQFTREESKEKMKNWQNRLHSVLRNEFHADQIEFKS